MPRVPRLTSAGKSNWILKLLLCTGNSGRYHDASSLLVFQNLVSVLPVRPQLTARLAASPKLCAYKNAGRTNQAVLYFQYTT